MKRYNFNEIYYASSERSVSSGYPGFGVRAYSEGLNASIIDVILNNGINIYNVNTERRLTYSQIVENPNITYDYPRTYIYTSIDVQGVHKYVVARIVYIGIDYGYFSGNKDAMRAGSNYFAHYMIFDELPPLSIINHLESNQMFIPVDYTCSPDNNELKCLLTGAPPVLSSKALEIPSTTEGLVDYRCDYNAGKCIVACLQAYTNKIRQKEEDLCKVIIKSPEKDVLHLIQSLAQINNNLNGLLNFTSNYMNGYGVPENYNMIFVNEHNTTEIYDHNFVCVDLFSNTNHNIEDNVFYDKILYWANEGDAKTLYKLVNYYLGLDLTKELNYQFLYNLFIAIESDKDILLQDISQNFINQLNNVQLSSTQEMKLWEKINSAVNSGLTAKKGSEINQAINIVGYILPTKNKHLKITKDSSSWITNVIFGENSYLSKIVNNGNIDIVMTLIDKTKILSDSAFYNALKQSQDTVVWTKFIQFYYADSLKLNVESVIENVLQSDLKKQEKEDLIKRLYPIDRCQNELLSYILNHTCRIPELIDIVKTICLNSREERFSLILKHSNNAPNIIKALSPIVLSYYGKQIDEDSNSGMKNLLSFIDRVSADVFNMMGLTEMFDKYIRMSMENPLKETKKIINTLLSSNVKIDRNTSEQIAVLNNLFDNEIPKRVDVNVLFTAHKMDKSADYIRDLYEAWLKTQPTPKDLKEYIKGVDYLSSDMIEEIILATWESRTRVIRENREDYVLIISDNSKWKSRDKKSFIKSCRDKDLVRHLTDSDKLIKKIIRKILNLFK
ncbi:MAG: hypothetical protein PARBA_04073 [Parabacteroides sp.]